MVVPFSTSSAWNNFNFDHASKLERMARIDIGALAPRDVFVYVQTDNMPAKVEQVPPPSAETRTDKAKGRSPAAHCRQPPRREWGHWPARSSPGTSPKNSRGRCRAWRRRGSSAIPTRQGDADLYGVRVERQRNDREDQSGTSKLLSPQPAFTLFVSHDGALDGWKHAFAGANGATVNEIAPNFYRISVGHEGYVDVVTSVEAIDHGHNPRERWMIWILIFGILVVVVIYRAFRG